MQPRTTVLSTVCPSGDLLEQARDVMQQTRRIREQLSHRVEAWDPEDSVGHPTLQNCEALETILHLTVQAEANMHRATALLTVLDVEERAFEDMPGCGFGPSHDDVADR